MAINVHLFTADPAEALHLVAEAAIATSRELKQVVAAMNDSGYASSLIQPYLADIGHALSVSSLSQDRGTLLKYLKEENILCLRWCSVVLADESIEIIPAEMEALKGLVSELDTALQESGIPPHFKRYATELLQRLKTAILMWPVQGGSQLKDAVRKAVADAEFDGEEIKTELAKSGDQPEVQTLREKLGGALKKAAEMTGDAEKLSKSYGYLLGKAYEAGQLISSALN